MVLGVYFLVVTIKGCIVIITDSADPCSSVYALGPPNSGLRSRSTS